MLKAAALFTICNECIYHSQEGLNTSFDFPLLVLDSECSFDLFGKYLLWNKGPDYCLIIRL